jgi:hypothetical protein
MEFGTTHALHFLDHIGPINGGVVGAIAYSEPPQQRRLVL